MNKSNKYQTTAVIYLILLVLLWAFVQLKGTKSGNLNFLYSFLFGLTPLFAGLVGMVKSAIWGRFKSTLGKALFFISFGLFCWGFGETIWSYYNFFRHVPAPYPSLADIGFAPSVFFWVVGAGYLSRASGGWLALKRSKVARAFAVVAVAAISVFSYYLLIRVARGNVLVPADESALKAVLDVAYPLGDYLAATFALIVFTLSWRYFGGLYRLAIGSILAGLGVMYIADFVFSYTTTVGSYYNADWGDLLLCLGVFLLSFGVLGFAVKPQISLPASEATEERA